MLSSPHALVKPSCSSGWGWVFERVCSREVELFVFGEIRSGVVSGWIFDCLIFCVRK